MRRDKVTVGLSYDPEDSNSPWTLVADGSGDCSVTFKVDDVDEDKDGPFVFIGEEALRLKDLLTLGTMGFAQLGVVLAVTNANNAALIGIRF